MRSSQSIAKLQRLCKQGNFRRWEISQNNPDTGKTWYTGWIHPHNEGPVRFCTDTLSGTLREMLKFAKEENHGQQGGNLQPVF